MEAGGERKPVRVERTVMDKLEQVNQIIAGIREDYHKAKGGNKAASTRVRKAMQDVKKLAGEIRAEMLEARTEG